MLLEWLLWVVKGSIGPGLALSALLLYLNMVGLGETQAGPSCTGTTCRLFTPSRNLGLEGKLDQSVRRLLTGCPLGLGYEETPSDRDPISSLTLRVVPAPTAGTLTMATYSKKGRGELESKRSEECF